MVSPVGIERFFIDCNILTGEIKVFIRLRNKTNQTNIFRSRNNETIGTAFTKGERK